MPTISKIAPSKRNENRRSVHVDGRFAFACNVNVVAKFGLREGLSLTADQVEAILAGELRQECFDRAMRLIERRLHSQAGVEKKLAKFEYPKSVIDAVLEDMKRLGYVNDMTFAKTRALSAAQYKKHGRNRAMQELGKAGVPRETARRAVEDVYESHDSLAAARELAQKKAKSLARFDKVTAKRRLMGLLLRRGYEYETIRPIIDEVLGNEEDTEA